MREVSTNGIRLLLGAIERAQLPADQIFEGLSLDISELWTPGRRVDWQVWVDLFTRLEAHLGTPEALESFSSLAATGPLVHPFQLVAQLFSSPVALYRLNSRWGIPSQFRNMRSSCEELEDGLVRISLSIPEDYRGSTAVFYGAAGVLRGLPKLIGLPESKVVSRELSTHHLTLVLEPPASRTLRSHVGRLTRRLQGLQSMIEQLGEQELELNQRRASLEQQLEDQKRVEAALRVSEERWRALAENAPGTILLLSISGEIRSSSGPFMGLDRRRLLGRRLSELVAVSDGPRLETSIEEVGRDRGIRDLEFSVMEAGREETWFSCRLGALDQENGEVTISAFLTDVTERVRAMRELREREAELLRAQKLEALGRLAGGVAHDFNNLLTVIRGSAELLMRGPWLVGDQREEIEQIQKAGDRAASLTRQLLAFARQQVIAPEALDLDQVIEEAKGMIERLMGKDIRIAVSLESHPWYVKLDRSQLDQILMNLAVNARDAMPHGGTLTIRARGIEQDSALPLGGAPAIDAGAYVELSVGDTGLGMDDATRERIFEPFFTTKAPGAGTGLGLAIVRGIVTHGGGHVIVDSQLGRGTTFRLLFPRCDAPPKSLPTFEPASSPSSGQTILLVEDDTQVRALVRKILTSRGYRVLDCKNATEALAYARTERLDLMLTDVVMPGISGPELARLMLDSLPTLAVLFMSGYAEHEIVHHGVVDVGVSLLSKPFTPDTLIESVRRRLDEGSRGPKNSI